MRRIILLLLALRLTAAVTVKSVETTPTQAVVCYVAPDANACTITLTEATFPGGCTT